MTKQIFTLLITLTYFYSANQSFGQSTAMDFNTTDCNGVQRHLFSDLDAGNAVILEFFMLNCSSCVTAGNKLEVMKSTLMNEYPGMIKSYAIGFSNSYTCTQISNWASTNGFTSIPMNGGAAQVAYYGGMGMPTIVILGGGANHSVLAGPYIGFTTSDTTSMAANIRSFLDVSTGNENPIALTTGISIYPNPANDILNIKIEVKKAGNLFIDVIDMLGKQVSLILDEKVNPGNIVKQFTSATLPNGNYVVRVNDINSSQNYKISIIH